MCQLYFLYHFSYHYSLGNNIKLSPLGQTYRQNQMSFLKLQTNLSQITMAESQLFAKPKNNIMCSSGQQALNICSNKICEKYPFVCSDKNCRCRQDHSECLKAQIEGLFTTILLKYNPKPIQQKIEQIFNQIHSQIQQFKKTVFAQLNQNLKQSQLSQKEQIFINCIEQQKYKELTGRTVWQIQSEIFKKNQNNHQIQNILKRLDIEHALFDPTLKQLFISIEKCLKSLKQDDQSKEPFHNSKLIASSDDIKTINQFFNRQIESTTLLYRASSNDFSINKFYQNCSNILNTLTICQTQFKKIIGGYTELPWFRTQKCEQVPDESGNTFLFSLTNKDKFSLSNKKYAINRSSSTSYGPAFGNGWDLFIRDKANTTKNSGGRINTSFTNENYTAQNKESKFLGTTKDSINCKLKQWQVWKIEFKSQSFKVSKQQKEK